MSAENKETRSETSDRRTSPGKGGDRAEGGTVASTPSRPAEVHATLDEWIARDAVRFDLASPGSLEAAVDRVLGELGPAVELLALGEALHGSEEILLVRNRMFRRLVEKHGFSAVAIEATSPQTGAINEYVLGKREASDPDVREWFGNGFGLLEANRELVEWVRRHNADASHPTSLHFYGFDLPLGQGGLANPSRALGIALDYLGLVDPARATTHRDRITLLVGNSSDWERPAAMFDPGQAIGLTPRATDLRIATLDLITDLRIRRPQYAAKSDPLAYGDALHHAELGRKLLDAHAALAKPGAYATMLGVRDLIMADNLRHVVACEEGRGKVLAFAAGGHLKRGTAQWHLPPGDDVKEWWPAGAQLTEALGNRYAVVGMALGASEPNGIAAPEAGTLEAKLAEAGGPMFIATHRGKALPAPEIGTAPARSGSTLNPTYSWLTPASFSDFEWLVFLDSTAYPRGGPSLTDWNAG
jgi:erythromycin esterase-like protein